jgi:hypothetical protein
VIALISSKYVNMWTRLEWKMDWKSANLVMGRQKKWFLRFPSGEFDHEGGNTGQQIDLTCV